MLQNFLVDVGLILIALVIFVVVLVAAGQFLGPVALVPASLASIVFMNRFPKRK